jgi:HTH-type transcriptional regulator/antitoxin HigA
MSATATIEKYDIDGFSAPGPITSDRQLDVYTETLYKLERMPKLSAPIEVLTELIAANNLKHKDLAPLLGGESIVSVILSGKRQLNVNQITKLSERFKVSPAVFFAA